MQCMSGRHCRHRDDVDAARLQASGHHRWDRRYFTNCYLFVCMRLSAIYRPSVCVTQIPGEYRINCISLLIHSILRYSGFHILKQCQVLVLGKETVEGARPPGHRAISSLEMLPPEQHPQKVAISQEMPITFSLQEGEISTPAPLQSIVPK